MPQFSQISKDRLSTCHPDLAILFNYVIQCYDCTVADGYRTKERQEEYFNQGLSKIHYPTVHNTKPSMAVDVYPDENGKPVFGNNSKEERQCLHFSGFVTGQASLLYQQGKIQHEVRCGVDWDRDTDVNDQIFNDICHFELMLSEEEKSRLQYFEI